MCFREDPRQTSAVLALVHNVGNVAEVDDVRLPATNCQAIDAVGVGDGELANDGGGAAGVLVGEEVDERHLRRVVCRRLLRLGGSRGCSRGSGRGGGWGSDRSSGRGGGLLGVRLAGGALGHALLEVNQLLPQCGDVLLQRGVGRLQRQDGLVQHLVGRLQRLLSGLELEDARALLLSLLLAL